MSEPTSRPPESTSQRIKEAASVRRTKPSAAPAHEAISALGKGNFIEWSDALSIGVKTIDDQHKGLVGMVNEISEGIKGGWGKEARDAVLTRLVEYTVVHFATEESLMNISHYPGEETHKKHHASLVEMVQQYIKKYQEDPSASNYDFLFFLKRWLVKHILKDDKMMGEYLVRKGVVKSESHQRLSAWGRLKKWLGFAA